MKSAHFLLTVGIALVVVSNAMGASISGVVTGRNITLFDGQQCRSCGEWYVGSGVGMEDQEVEYHSVTGQAWDLEAFFWDGSLETLFIVAGFDFQNGVQGRAAGDLFLFGKEGQPDYVIDFKRTGDLAGVTDHRSNLSVLNGIGEFQVHAGDFPTTAVSYQEKSNPYTIDTAYQTGIASGGFSLVDHLSDGMGLSGDIDGPSHNVMALSFADLRIIADAINSGYRLHLTLECGNDALAGQVHAPEPKTLALFGVGLICCASYSRKVIKK